MIRTKQNQLTKSYSTTEIQEYKKILIKIDKNFEYRVFSYLSKKNTHKSQPDWLYITIYDNTSYDFCTHFGKLSGLVGRDPKFKTTIQYVLEDDNHPIKLRFFGYFLIYTFYRHKSDYSIAKKLMEKWYDLFQNEDMYHVTRCQILGLSDLPEEIEQSIRIVTELKERGSFRNNPNINTTYTNCILRALEEEVNNITHNRIDYIDKAIDLIQTALTQKEYAKNYFLKGKLLFYKAKNNNDPVNLLKRAKKSIKRAIDLEDSFREDYTLRILEYNSFITRIDIHLDVLKLQTSLNQTTEAAPHQLEFQVLSFLEQEKKQILKKLLHTKGLDIKDLIKDLLESEIDHYRRFSV